jgi:hypothetical protein
LCFWSVGGVALEEHRINGVRMPKAEIAGKWKNEREKKKRISAFWELTLS